MAYSSPSSSSGYDVFLSFRGEDIRKPFVDHLYMRLREQNIHTFRDDEILGKGSEIAPELLKAIEGSRFAIVLFSRNYADSTWCLDELVKIIECKHSKGQIVVPVFHDVEPTEVRRQEGSYAAAFARHKVKSPHKVEIWKKALIEAASIAGWDHRYRNEEVPTSRGDGWMEVKMGEFYNGEGHDREVVARVMQHSDFEKSGLIVGGIEFHPLD
ncbi:hypothetical protein RJ640_007637 [Escallonia rubra]|uniref:TIR domain-containing protein n=1 Tax=Escallonia rubra TaxID=112253 RepID=A0AA88RM31_9ASTE|nr:hypothetical protein RJ640_007637 [Escallonia rubra]